MSNTGLEEIVDLFMKENDSKALEKLYELTNDRLVKILLEWRVEYGEFIDDYMTYPGSMYSDIIEYVWDKYKLNEVTNEVNNEEEIIQ